MFEIGKARKSLPIRPAAASWSSVTDGLAGGQVHAGGEDDEVGAEREVAAELRVGETVDLTQRAARRHPRARVRGAHVEA